uniref:tRNA phosphotransferase 1 n=1 Tax=Varanus komodoensis TaxID=61221 RepID=A0A8D2JA90_VARKO
VVAHGTYLRHWTAIRRSGLSRMGRTHIHLAPGLPGDGTVVSGEHGIAFYRSANGVLLTPGDANGRLLPQYFREALQLRPTRKSQLVSPTLPHLHFCSSPHRERERERLIPPPEVQGGPGFNTCPLTYS